MQLDQTHIAIRERGLLEICDLALRVFVDFSPRLLIVLLVGMFPLAAMNWWLLRGLVEADPSFYGVAYYFWCMAMLVFIEAPLATSLATIFLGDAMFQQPPTLGHVLRACWNLSGRLFVAQFLLRGVLLALVLAATLSQYELGPSGVLLFLLATAVMGVRDFRPFINEIVLLERNPLRSRDRRTMTVGRRSSNLHRPNAADLFVRSLGCWALSIMMTVALVFGFWFYFGMLWNDWQWGPVMIHICVPAAMWVVAGYFAVVRYLCYLDLRIRREGWAVELHMRAEATRLTRALA